LSWEMTLKCRKTFIMHTLDLFFKKDGLCYGQPVPEFLFSLYICSEHAIRFTSAQIICYSNEN